MSPKHDEQQAPPSGLGPFCEAHSNPVPGLDGDYWICTRSPGHDGDHHAVGYQTPTSTWPQDSPDARNSTRAEAWRDCMADYKNAAEKLGYGVLPPTVTLDERSFIAGWQMARERFEKLLGVAT